MHHCTLAVECMSVVLSGMGVSSGGWFLHRIGISIIHGTLCLDREIQTIVQTLPLPQFVFVLHFLYKTKRGIYTYKRVVCVCLFVCWFVCFLSAT